MNISITIFYGFLFYDGYTGYMKRVILITITVLLVLLGLPWLALAIVAGYSLILHYRRPIELPIIGLLADILYQSHVHIFDRAVFLYISISLVLYLIIYLLQKRILVYAE